MFRSIFTLPASALSNYGLSSAHRQKAEANTPLGRRAAACRPRVMASHQDGIALDPATASLITVTKAVSCSGGNVLASTHR
jgi:hypothetical protein